jgi:flagellar biosynthesis anti-sigma factor FlgM
MRIIDSNSLGSCASNATGRTGQTQGVQESARKNGADRSGQSQSDTVELSGSSKSVDAAWNAYAASRAQRVQQLAAAVQGGTYEPDAGAVSSKMVDEALGTWR